MQASVSSTIGEYSSNAAIIDELRRMVLASPQSYNGKPCTVLAVVGPIGSGKSTILNKLCSILTGGQINIQRSESGAEQVASTVQNSLIPIHTFLFDDPDPPAYFFIWDTIGLRLEPSRTYGSDDGDVTGPIQNILSGKLRNYSNSLTLLDREAKIALPVQAIIVTHHSSKNIKHVLKQGDDLVPQASYLKALNTRCARFSRCDANYDHFNGVPLYCVATSYETIEAMNSPIFNMATRSENWDLLLTSPSLVASMLHLSEATGIPYGRCFPTFGLNVLRPTKESTDVRITALLLPFLSAVREVVHKSRLELQMSQLLRIRDGITVDMVHVQPKSLMYMSVSELAHHFNAILGTAAAEIVEAQGINGECLVELTDEQINTIFNAQNAVGLCSTIKRLVKPYRTCATKPPATIPSLQDLVNRASNSVKAKLVGYSQLVVFTGTLTQNAPVNQNVNWHALSVNNAFVNYADGQLTFVTPGWYKVEIYVKTLAHTCNDQALILRKNGNDAAISWGPNGGSCGYLATVPLSEYIEAKENDYLHTFWRSSGYGLQNIISPADNRFTLIYLGC